MDATGCKIVSQEMLVPDSAFEKPSPLSVVTHASDDDELENFDCCCSGGGGGISSGGCCPPAAADEATGEVAESFEMLHQAIPWLQKAGVSSDSHRGQLKILQAAIDYIIDLEEQLTEHLSEDLYRVAIRESKAALERSLRSRRPFADLNATDEDEEDCFDNDDDYQQQQQQQQQQQSFAHQLSAAAFLGASFMRDNSTESTMHRPW